MKGKRKLLQAAPDAGTQYLHAAVVRMDPEKPHKVVALVGCGGTGGWLAPSLARIAYVLQKNGKEIELIFMDGDTVEEVNIGRQNFCAAEIGQNKATALANRYGSAWGLEIEAIPQPFGDRWTTWANRHYHDEILLVGCVDNAQARKNMARLLEYSRSWWLDCGNGKDNGQVLLGNETRKEEIGKAFPSRRVCIRLPAPHIQEPTLLIPRPDEDGARKLSCAELARLNAQSLAVNQRTAAEAADMLVRLLVTHDLTRYAVYFDLSSGTAVSRYITPENILPAGSGRAA